MLISTALLLDSIIRNSVCTPAKLPCRRVEVGYEKQYILHILSSMSEVMIEGIQRFCYVKLGDPNV
jgi:hypothetical protein